MKYQSNLSLYSLYYAEACNEFTGPVSASFRSGNTAPFEEMLQGWRTIDNAVSDLNLRLPVPETNALLLDQLAGFKLGFQDLFQFLTVWICIVV